MRACGLVLAAGAGSRFGGPKGLARTASGEAWVALSVRMLREGGCDDVLVAVGARGDEVAGLVPGGAAVVAVPEWSDGLSATVRAGMRAAADTGADVVVVVPVDTPELPASAVARVVAAARGGVAAGAGSGAGAGVAADAAGAGAAAGPGSGPGEVTGAGAGSGDVAGSRGALVQALYGGRPGHPVVIGVDHLQRLEAALRGDRGAGAYLAEHGARRIECGDLWSGRDVDRR
ncbi:nucleotidyltransferase family protein [Microbacterium thalassium]|uniref:CTP:molybdopterin cytidylyltransferase MocA n=1 Tax=Microbacterium thalassium TaxID=362649 RepID=A0A7X0FMC6_9MICO|nr:NTP transferase domain-containing protein [Microbacterium thalassium]MBB6390129.1 CTP:molybdopterin cytidylyltransferase MocA [Microbacterium thalassium]GLK25237.1 molybdopterin-guanine dinucleotide biosynthesis protein MobA [Microbacterium thalassium]